MNSGKLIRRMMVSLGMGAVLSTGMLVGPLAVAQISSPQVPVHSFQRSAEIYNFSMAATSGPQRGEEIYYFKCWFCHNDYVIKAGTPAPSLQGLFQRPRLTTGQPVNEQTVTQKIRNGGALMPAYRHTLTDADIADLVRDLRDKNCCFDGEEPPANPRYRANSGPRMEFEGRNNLRGGPKGLARTAAGMLLEGILVQLIAQETAVRTTVSSNDEGRFEFPKLPTGVYTLRIARPLEFRPYQRDSVRIDGATELGDIVLERLTDSDLLPPTPEIMAQLAGAEWLKNIPGTGQEKKVFSHACGFGCHSYQQIFRARYDEHGWRQVINRMVSYRGSPLIVPFEPSPNLRGRSGLLIKDEIDLLANWLARVRGPDSKDISFDVFPGPRGAATRVIVTEYELPRLLLAPHDVCGDSKGGFSLPGQSVTIDCWAKALAGVPIPWLGEDPPWLC